MDITEEEKREVITPFQRMNLAKLALVLKNKKPSKHFHMDYYTLDSDTGAIVFNVRPKDLFNKKTIHKCNTAACAGGWAAIAGIGDIHPIMTWPDYIDHNFISQSPNDSDRFSTVRQVLFSFMFGSQHPDVPKEAAKRIAFVVENTNYCDIDDEGYMPKSWQPNWKLVKSIAESNVKNEKISMRWGF